MKKTENMVYKEVIDEQKLLLNRLEKQTNQKPIKGYYCLLLLQAYDSLQKDELSIT